MGKEGGLYQHDGADPENIEGRNAYHQLSKFITQVWEHPLVDNRTRKHRAYFTTAAAEFIERYHMDKKRIALIPIGSFPWITSNESDYDVHFICKGDETVHVPSNEVTYPQAIHVPNVKIDIDTITDHPELTPLSVLLTPDNYIFGNTEIVASARLAYLNATHADEISQVSAYTALSRHFDQFYRHWAAHFSEKSVGRMTRFNKNLILRAIQAHMPDHLYREKFIQALETVKVPSIQQYLSGLEYSQGKLELDPSYAASGINKASLLDRMRRW